MRCARRTKNTWLSIGLARARLLALAARVVQEHQIEVRGVAELHAAELAVADGADAHVARARAVSHIGAPNCAVICRQPSAMARSTMSSAISVSRSLTCMSGSTPVTIGHRHPEQRGALELAQRLDLAAPDRPRPQLLQTLLELGGAARRGSGSCVSRRSSISSSSSSGCAAICAARKSPWPAQLDESRRAPSVLLQQRKVRRALARWPR